MQRVKTEDQRDESMRRTRLDVAGFDGGSGHSQGIQASPLGAGKGKETDCPGGAALLTPCHSSARLILDFRPPELQNNKCMLF